MRKREQIVLEIEEDLNIGIIKNKNSKEYIYMSNFFTVLHVKTC